jgi:hypothetical protein
VVVWLDDGSSVTISGFDVAAIEEEATQRT